MKLLLAFNIILYYTTQICIVPSRHANQKCWGWVIAIAYVSYAVANSSDFKQRLKLLKVFADPKQFQTWGAE